MNNYAIRQEQEANQQQNFFNQPNVTQIHNKQNVKSHQKSYQNSQNRRYQKKESPENLMSEEGITGKPQKIGARNRRKMRDKSDNQ